MHMRNLFIQLVHNIILLFTYTYVFTRELHVTTKHLTTSYEKKRIKIKILKIMNNENENFIFNS